MAETVAVASTPPSRYVSAAHTSAGASFAAIEPVLWGRNGAKPQMRLVSLSDTAAVFEWTNFGSCEASTFTCTVYVAVGADLSALHKITLTPGTPPGGAGYPVTGQVKGLDGVNVASAVLVTVETVATGNQGTIVVTAGTEIANNGQLAGILTTAAGVFAFTVGDDLAAGEIVIAVTGPNGVTQTLHLTLTGP